MNKMLQRPEKFARASLFIIFFWFGILKTLGDSPAEELVHHLCELTIRLFIKDDIFIPAFGVFECLLGVSILFHRLTKWSMIALWGHMTMTVLPLIFLPNDSWQALLTPTLIGQYIIKNLAILSLSFFLWKEAAPKQEYIPSQDS